MNLGASVIIAVTLTKDNFLDFLDTRESLRIQSKPIIHYVFDSSSDFHIRDFCLRESDLIYVYIPAIGIYGSMNYAINYLSKVIFNNPYILFLNAGDCLESFDVVENVIQLQNFNHNWIYCDYLIEDSKTNLRKRISLEGWSLNRQLYSRNPINHQAVFVRLKTLQEMNGFDESYSVASDWDLIARLSLKHKGQYIKIISTVFRLGGHSSEYRDTGNKELLKLRRNYLKLNYLQNLSSNLYFAWRFFRNLVYVSLLQRNSGALSLIRKFLGWKLDNATGKTFGGLDD